MHMVRQHDPGVDAKRRLPADFTHRYTQRVDLRREEAGTAVAQVHREKIGGARDPVASVIRHRGNMPETCPRVERRAGATRLPTEPMAACAALHPPYVYPPAALRRLPLIR